MKQQISGLRVVINVEWSTSRWGGGLKPDKFWLASFPSVFLTSLDLKQPPSRELRASAGADTLGRHLSFHSNSLLEWIRWQSDRSGRLGLGTRAYGVTWPYTIWSVIDRVMYWTGKHQCLTRVTGIYFASYNTCRMSRRAVIPSRYMKSRTCK